MNEQPPPLFRYIPLTDYAVPLWPTTEHVRRGWRAFWHSINFERNGEKPAVDPKLLAHLPQAELEGVACPQNTATLVEALTTALKPWLRGTPPNGPVRVLVSAAHCATPAALHGWAQTQGWKFIEPPSTDQILAGGEAWLAAIAKLGDADCVLPRLEQCFLRHAEGLDLFRRLLAWLLARRGRCLVGCNSWAWAFLRAELGVDTVLPTPLTLAPFNDNDGARTLQCAADFYLHPRHDAAAVRQKLQDVALTSPYLALDRPVAVVLAEKPWGTPYRLKAYPIDARDQFAFTSDLTMRGKAVLVKLGVQPVCAPTTVPS